MLIVIIRWLVEVVEILELLDVMLYFRAYDFDFMMFLLKVFLDVRHCQVEVFSVLIDRFLGFASCFRAEVQRSRFRELPLDAGPFHVPV